MTLAGAVLFSSVLHTKAEALTAVLLAAGAVMMIGGFIVWVDQLRR